MGGTADAARVEKAFRIILKDPAVKAILVNIFGGIVRCDRVAQGVVDACKNMSDINVPIIVRLQGTNAEEAKQDHRRVWARGAQRHLVEGSCGRRGGRPRLIHPNADPRGLRLAT